MELRLAASAPNSPKIGVSGLGVWGFRGLGV